MWVLRYFKSVNVSSNKDIKNDEVTIVTESRNERKRLEYKCNTYARESEMIRTFFMNNCINEVNIAFKRVNKIAKFVGSMNDQIVILYVRILFIN